MLVESPIAGTCEVSLPLASLGVRSEAPNRACAHQAELLQQQFRRVRLRSGWTGKGGQPFISSIQNRHLVWCGCPEKRGRWEKVLRSGVSTGNASGECHQTTHDMGGGRWDACTKFRRCALPSVNADAGRWRAVSACLANPPVTVRPSDCHTSKSPGERAPRKRAQADARTRVETQRLILNLVDVAVGETSAPRAQRLHAGYAVEAVLRCALPATLGSRPGATMANPSTGRQEDTFNEKLC